MEHVKAKLKQFKKWLIAAATIIIVFLASIFAGPILFPLTPPTAVDTLTLRPNAAGTYQQWTLVGTNHWTATNDSSDSTYVYALDTSVKETENFADTTHSAETINGVTAYMKCVSTGSAGAEYARVLWRVSSTDYESASKSISRSTFTWYSESRAVSPYTSAAWTWTEINAIQVGSRVATLGAEEEMECSEYYISIAYVAPDTTPPTYSNVAANTTYAGRACLFYSKWTDETGLATTGGYMVGTNNTGPWVNATWTAFTANPDWGNKTVTLNTTLGLRVEWCVYANDTNNNWNSTGIQFLIITSDIFPQYSNVGTNMTYGATFFLRAVSPTHGQDVGNGHDVGLFNNSQPLPREERHCILWVQFDFDGGEDVQLWNITKIHWHIYWNGTHQQILGICCNGSYVPTMPTFDYSATLGNSTDYSLYEADWNVNIAPPMIGYKYNFTIYVWTGMGDLGPGNPSVLCEPSNLSYVTLYQTTQNYVSCKFYANWTDSYGLNAGGFIFSTNNYNGTWLNNTWAAFSPSYPYWSNFTCTLNLTVPVVISWRIWVNNSANNWNDTGIHSAYDTTSLAVGWNNFTAWSLDVGKTLSQVNASLYLSYISFSQIGFEYANGTRYMFFPDWGGDSAVTVTADGTFYILCNTAGMWEHKYT